MSEQAAATPTEEAAKPAALMAEGTSIVKAAEATPEAKPAGEPAKAAEPAKAEPTKEEAKKTSIISDAGKVAEPKLDKDGKPIPEAKAGEDKAKKEGEPAKTGVPEKYEIKAPEGMTLDETKISEFTPIAKELGLTNEGLQKLVDYQAKQIAKATEAQAQAFEDFKTNTQKEAVEFFGPKLEAELPYVAKARDNFFSKETMDLLEATGLTNHKSVIADFAKIGRAFAEDKLVEGKAAAPEDTRTPGQIIYGKDKN